MISLVNNKIESNQMKNTLLDLLTSIAIGLLLAIGALEYFDILTK